MRIGKGDSSEGDALGIAEVRKLARKMDPEPSHVFQVSKNALGLFDATTTLHKLGRPDRRLLEAAALLHDLGHTIEVTRHHKHSRDIILRLELPGFTAKEKRIIACVARYHRKAHPSPAHTIFRDLKKEERRRVERLAAILRIADGLDRCHEASCKGIRACRVDDILTITVEQRHPNPTDIWGAQRKQPLFEEVFGVSVKIEAFAKRTPAQKEVL